MRPEPTIAQIDAARVWLAENVGVELPDGARALAIDRIERESAISASQPPIQMRLPCPKCGELHIDEGEFATKSHHTHSCQHCGLTWRPAVVATVGVRFLPGFRNDVAVDWKGVLPHQLRVTCVDCPGGEAPGTNAPGTFGWTFSGSVWRCGKHSSF
jgi:hypothetical protein